MSSFQKKSIQRVRLWIENFKTCQTLKKHANKKSHIESCYSAKTACFALSLLFRKAWFWNKKFKMVWFFELKSSRSIHFDVKEYQSLTIWIFKNQPLCSAIVFKTSHESIDKFNNVSEFDLKNLHFFNTNF